MTSIAMSRLLMMKNLGVSMTKCNISLLSSNVLSQLLLNLFNSYDKILDKALHLIILFKHYHKLNNTYEQSCFILYVILKKKSNLNPLYFGNPQRVLWQTVKTQMKCSIMLHFIGVYTICYD